VRAVQAAAAGLALVVALGMPSGAAAQGETRVARVGALVPSTREAWKENIDAFRVRLRELGWIEGKNLVLEVRYADDRYDRLPALASALVASKPDVIFAGASAATDAARHATTTIPIVFETLGDAVSLGIVANLGDFRVLAGAGDQTPRANASDRPGREARRGPGEQKQSRHRAHRPRDRNGGSAAARGCRHG